jgi:hypothetical protein
VCGLKWNSGGRYLAIGGNDNQGKLSIIHRDGYFIFNFCSLLLNKKFCQNSILWKNMVASNHKSPETFVYAMNDCAKKI